MANSGSTTHCGGGTSQERIDCIVNACQYNMTNDCFNTMMDTPQDFSTFHALLSRTCALGSASGLNVPLSDNCRRFCRGDPVACRANRQRYCSTFADPGDPRTRDLCACYLPTYLYTRITAEAIADLSIQSAGQLTTLQDVISNNLLTPSCWYGDCVKSTYGGDTEATTPCQSLGLCIQSISTTGASFKGRVDLKNSCSITTVTQADALTQTLQDGEVQESVVMTDVVPLVVTPTITMSLGWLWIVLIVLILVLVIAIVYLMARPVDKEKRTSATNQLNDGFY